jgi:hypothetical protein
VKEVEFSRIQDQAYYVVHLDTPPRKLRAERLHQPYYITGRAERDRLLVAADTMRVREEPFSVESLMARLQDGAAGRNGRRADAPHRVRRLLLLARRADAASRCCA